MTELLPRRQTTPLVWRGDTTAMGSLTGSCLQRMNSTRCVTTPAIRPHHRPVPVRVLKMARLQPDHSGSLVSTTGLPRRTLGSARGSSPSSMAARTTAARTSPTAFGLSGLFRPNIPSSIYLFVVWFYTLLGAARRAATIFILRACARTFFRL